MNQPTATQLEMQAIDPLTALGTDGLTVPIAGVTCHVTLGTGHGHVVVTDDHGTHHDFTGWSWARIKREMEAYFDAVGSGV